MANLAHKATSQIQPGYSFSLPVEENFDYLGSLDFLNNNWHIPWILSLLFYLPVLYIGQTIMKKYEPLRLRLPMILWNSGLAIFSIIGFTRVFPEMMHSLANFGFQHSVCNNSYIHVKPTRYWIFLFVLSKIPELGDTFFLVLRKQKLIFLHVYHHASVLVFSWFVYSNSLATARWFCTMNFGVHSIMYTYYVLKAFPNVIRIPKFISMIITTLQITQMVLGAIVVASSYYTELSGQPCSTTTTMSISSLAIYLSYLCLFSQFFYKAYCSPRPPRDGKNIVVDKKEA